MSEWKDVPVTNEQFDRTIRELSKVIVSATQLISQALERNTKAVLSAAMLTGQIGTRSITTATTVSELEKLLAEHLNRSY